MKFIAVVGPFAKAIQCLESLNTNLADVYLYWLAIVSQLVYLFSHNQVGLSAQTMEDIRVITNKCFDQMINKSPNDVYITVFFLNLRELGDTLQESSDNSAHNLDHRGAQIFKHINPLSIPALILKPNGMTNPPSNTGILALKLTAPKKDILTRAGLLLQQLLKK